jgi:hypothetical protein
VANQRLELVDKLRRRLGVARTDAIPQFTESRHVRHQSLAGAYMLLSQVLI